MTEIDGRQWAVAVFGPVVLLVGLVALAYTGIFAVPGAPCGDARAVSPPNTSFAVTSNGSAVTVVHVGNSTVGGPRTDRIAVSVRNAETGDATSRTWISSNDSLTRGDSITIPARKMPFTLSDRDRVSVDWYGVDPSAPSACPNGRTFSELTIVRVENASTLIETAS